MISFEKVIYPMISTRSTVHASRSMRSFGRRCEKMRGNEMIAVRRAAATSDGAHTAASYGHVPRPPPPTANSYRQRTTGQGLYLHRNTRHRAGLALGRAALEGAGSGLRRRRRTHAIDRRRAHSRRRSPPTRCATLLAPRPSTLIEQINCFRNEGVIANA